MFFCSRVTKKRINLMCAPSCFTQPREGEGGPTYVKDSQEDDCINIVLWKCVIYSKYAGFIYIERAYFIFYVFLCVKELALSCICKLMDLVFGYV